MTHGAVALLFVVFVVLALACAAAVWFLASRSARRASAPLGWSHPRVVCDPLTIRFGDGSGWRFDGDGLTVFPPAGRAR